MKEKRIVVLQPSYIPWIGYFDQIIRSDIFVFYDNSQYTKNDWRNRNCIRTQKDRLWLTVPVKFGSLKTPICDVKIDQTKNWKKKHLKTLCQFYGKSKYFNEVYEILESNITATESNLSELNIKIIKDISSYLDITTKFYIASELGVAGSKNEFLINICNYFNIAKYLTGDSARSYLDLELFNEHGIEVEFQNYKHPVYKQQSVEFIPYLSIIDLLFNYGKESTNIIKGEF